MPSVNQHLASASSFVGFFSQRCSDARSREFGSLGLSKGAILPFKLSFDAASKRVPASGSNFCLLFRFVQTNYKDLH